MKFAIYRHYRAAWVHWEFCKHFWSFGIANPNHHAWWAFTIYIYTGR